MLFGPSSRHDDIPQHSPTLSCNHTAACQLLLTYRAHLWPHVGPVRNARGKGLGANRRPFTRPNRLCVNRKCHGAFLNARDEPLRKQSPPQIHRNIQEMIRFIEAELKALDQRIRDLIRFQEHLYHKERVMLKVKRVGKVTAWTILAYLSEITQTDRSRITALVGVAPYNKDSGKTFKKRCIQAGRAKIRRTLYMANDDRRNPQPSHQSLCRQTTVRER